MILCKVILTPPKDSIMIDNAPSSDLTSLKTPTQAAEVVDVSMLTPVGFDLMSTVTALRAGINVYKSSSFLGKNLWPIKTASIPTDALPPLNSSLRKAGLTSRQKRILRIATTPLQSIFKKVSPELKVPLFLAAPEKLPGRHHPVNDKMLKMLAIQSGCPLDLENSYVIPAGRAAGFYALESAMLMLETGLHPYVLVGGVDSFWDLHWLSTHSAQERLLTERSQDAFAPGEAAVFILLQSPTQAANRVCIFPPGIGLEPGHRYSEEPYLGAGLDAAVKEAFVNYQGAPIEAVFSSMNGENICAKEWGVSVIRSKSRFADSLSIIHPADSLGDVGAAMAPLLMGYAATSLILNQIKGPCLLWASSEFADRGAACIALEN